MRDWSRKRDMLSRQKILGMREKERLLEEQWEAQEFKMMAGTRSKVDSTANIHEIESTMSQQASRTSE